ncbi:MAG TPA: TetR/AcrR family transcriptional regulator, partial [Xanthobacteraceae bacterium]|nr:TetR/AcrR family transcriptional regulator [Xanthobacteraceae bacterium]
MRQNARAKKLPRLDKRAWIAAAFAELAAHGWDGVRVEPIAATLGVTKGSFYWHFADRDALVGAMFIRWAEGRVRAIRHGVKPDGRPALIMPSEDYNRFTNDDLSALVSYVRQLPPQESAQQAVVDLPRPAWVLYG